MPTEVIIKNPELDGKGTDSLIVNPPIADVEHSKHYLTHGGVEQIKTHGGLTADIEINNFNEKDGWGKVGGEIGSQFNELIQKRKEPIYGVGYSVLGFGKVVAIAAMRGSQNPTVHFYLDVEGLLNRRDKEIADRVYKGVREYCENFASSIGADLFLLSAPFERFRTSGSIPYGDSLADLHHRIEALFKALGNALRQYKARPTIGFGGDSIKPRIAELSEKHGEAEMLCKLNLDGSGKGMVELTSALDSKYLERFAAGQKILASRGRFDLNLSCKSIGRHHTIEDLGIPQGRAFLDAVKKNPNRLVRFGNDFYIDERLFALATVGISNRYSFIGNYSQQFMEDNDTTLHYLEQMLQDARWETYLHIGTPDFQQMPFNNNTAYKILYEVFKPNSEYSKPSNTIRPYEEQHIDDPDLALFYVLGGAIRMGTRIDRSQAEGVASSKGVVY